MQVKEAKPLNFLYFRTKARMGELGRFVGVIARELYRDAVRFDLEITGPLYWSYEGYTGRDTDSFVLDIGIPLSEIPGSYHGMFQLKREDAFPCVSLIHEGSWVDLQDSYSRITEFMAARGLEGCGKYREVYINIDFMNPTGNVTELQIGLHPESFEEVRRLLAGREEVYADSPGPNPLFSGFLARTLY
ncbi:MAG: GyrI-like domain-containing protein [Cyclobacteriaceae bacterium]|nr:GyrI-like domain-containing protein [Cyclobacteriaceae bacterium]